LSGRGLCDELITRPEESYRLCCVVVCDLETSRMGAPYIYDISRLRVNALHKYLCAGSDRDQVHKSYVRFRLLHKHVHAFVTLIPIDMNKQYQACFNNTAKVAPCNVIFLITQNF